MQGNAEGVDLLKFKLKTVIKHRINNEKTGNSLKNLARTLSEDLVTVKEEIDFLSEQLTELKVQIADAHQQVSMIEICRTSELAKFEATIGNLNSHKHGFEDLFRRAQESLKIQQRELLEKEEQKEQLKRRRLEELSAINEQQIRKAEAAENEIEALQRECSVLKKRNAAIMLKLRRKLLETEDTRRELLRAKEVPPQ